VGIFTSAQQAWAQLKNCDLVLIGTNLPENEAISLTQTSTRGDYGAKVLIVGLAETNQAIIRYIEAGAHGFIRREDSVEDLLKIIRSILKGEAIISPDLASDVLLRLAELARYFEELAPPSAQTACLTPREREVLKLMGRYYTNREIANHLIIEVGTVKNHVHNILSKLNVSSRREATSYIPALVGQTTGERWNEIPALSAVRDPYLSFR
jgi:DNA-binding NarL/FixJ family response regulator